jgi:hypothetical protein
VTVQDIENALKIWGKINAVEKKSLGRFKVASATSTRLVTSEPAWLTK